jgi:hypothetical protein
VVGVCFAMQCAFPVGYSKRVVCQQVGALHDQQLVV